MNARTPVVDSLSDTVEAIRVASRALVRELGFMDTTLAGTALSPSAVHALIELERSGECTAGDLGRLLRLEKSSVSRLLARLVAAGSVAQQATRPDGREKSLALTAQGRAQVEEIHCFARSQVQCALAHLPPQQHGSVVKALATYAEALRASQAADAPPPAQPSVEIQRGLPPGALGRIVEMHARYYARERGFGRFFEAKLARELADFAGRLDDPRNALWVALRGGTVVGSIAIDADDFGPQTAHLRWFILDDGLRGSGTGRRLLARATAFCDRQDYPATDLWTLSGLDAARRLYDDAGFALVEEVRAAQWGKETTEQRFRRMRPVPSKTD
ncbi:helix-turn-helix domain-containing GNAT family N-acetyltransferase [Xylophilus sp. GW821-FHT01B05]